MDNVHVFSQYWSDQTPFFASFALQQLRLWVSHNPWFAWLANHASEPLPAVEHPVIEPPEEDRRGSYTLFNQYQHGT